MTGTINFLWCTSLAMPLDWDMSTRDPTFRPASFPTLTKQRWNRHLKSLSCQVCQKHVQMLSKSYVVCMWIRSKWGSWKISGIVMYGAIKYMRYKFMWSALRIPAGVPVPNADYIRYCIIFSLQGLSKRRRQGPCSRNTIIGVRSSWISDKQRSKRVVNNHVKLTHHIHCMSNNCSFSCICKYYTA